MKRSALALLLSFFSLCGVALSQSRRAVSDMPYSGAPCTASGGIPPSAQQVTEFNRFDKELRSAFQRNDPAALAFLTHFPLRVNTNKGALLIPDAQSLGGHYAEIFPAEVRDRVIATVPADYFCRYDEGLGYKDGVIWASTDGHRFTLQAVNQMDLHVQSKKSILLYTCETKSHRILIEELAYEEFRYRSWNKPKSLSETPDIDLAHGKQTFPGTGVCSIPTYIFTSGNVTYEVDGGLGCTDGSEPAKATGHLSVNVGDKQVTDDWCF